MECSDGFLKEYQENTKVINEKLFKSYHVYQAAFQEWVHLFQYFGSICVVPRWHPGNPRFPLVLRDLWLQLLVNSTWVWFLSLIC